jgi:hypothetical protein
MLNPYLRPPTRREVDQAAQRLYQDVEAVFQGKSKTACNMDSTKWAELILKEADFFNDLDVTESRLLLEIISQLPEGHTLKTHLQAVIEGFDEQVEEYL